MVERTIYCTKSKYIYIKYFEVLYLYVGCGKCMIPVLRMPKYWKLIGMTNSKCQKYSFDIRDERLLTIL